MNPDWADIAATEIWETLSDRRGFGLGSLEYDDPDLYAEIIGLMASIIRRAGREKS